MSGFAKRYEIYFPDGTVERGAVLGPVKEPEETISLSGREWRIARVAEVDAEDVDYELHVEFVDE
jgi:hypothetical protein